MDFRRRATSSPLNSARTISHLDLREETYGSALAGRRLSLPGSLGTLHMTLPVSIPHS